MFRFQMLLDGNTGHGPPGVALGMSVAGAVGVEAGVLVRVCVRVAVRVAVRVPVGTVPVPVGAGGVALGNMPVGLGAGMPPRAMLTILEAWARVAVLIGRKYCPGQGSPELPHAYPPIALLAEALST